MHTSEESCVLCSDSNLRWLDFCTTGCVKSSVLESLLRSSARSYFDARKQHMLRPVSEDAGIETWLGPGGLHVDPVIHYSWRHYVGLVRDLLRLVPSVLSRMLGSSLVSSSLSKKADNQGFIVNARASNRHCSIPLFGPLLTGEGLCQVEFQEAPEGAQNWFAGFVRY